MSEPRSKTKTKSEAPAADDGELDQIADELYAMRPDEFAAARDELVRKARADGRAPLARELNKLRKPTQSAWLINLLWRDQRDVMERLFELAEALSQAQAQASGPELLRLTGQRRELESALMRRARALAEKEGVSFTAPMEREAQETLSAAVAMREVADEVRSGRLVKPAAYAGFGAGLGMLIPPARTTRQPLPSAERTGAESVDAPQPDELASKRAAAGDRDRQARSETEPAEQARIAKVADFEARAAQRADERRAAAERQVAEARAALDNAAGVVADRDRAVEATAQLKQELQDEQQNVRQRLAELQKEVDELRGRQRDLQAEIVAAEQSTLAAGRRRDQAEKSREAAQRALEDVEQQVKDSP